MASSTNDSRSQGSDHLGDVLHDLFSRQAVLHPTATALTSGAENMTYGELEERSSNLAQELIMAGVNVGDLVAISMPRSIGLIVAIIAILKTGAAYVPMDPSHPSERLALLVEDCRPRLIIVTSATSDCFADVQAQLFRCNDQGEASSRSVADDLVPSVRVVSPNDLAYVIYTSGTTGIPKGVMMEHRSVTRLFGTTRPFLKFTVDDIWTLYHSAAFDISVWEMWGALLSGGRLVIATAEDARNPVAFYRTLCAEGVTILNQTPSALAGLQIAQARSNLPHSLRLVICGGEVLGPHLVGKWLGDERNTATHLINMYGITETCVHVTFRYERSGEDPSLARSVGIPFPDLQIHILDEDLKPIPEGQIGELCIAGAGLARGYLNRPKLDAERFVRSRHIGAVRMYRSGDLGRRLPNGEIEYLGRNDQQVKIDGYRIELEEIESHLGTLSNVTASAVLVEPSGRRGRNVLAAYVVTQDGAELDAAAVRQQLRNVLPEYMLPSRVTVVSSMPLTVNGKLNRNELRSLQK